MIDKTKVLSIITNRKYIIIAIAMLVVIGLGIVGIIIFQNSREISSTNDGAPLDDAQYNLIRLEIFRLCILMFLIAAAGAVCILLCLKIKLEYIYLVAALSLGTAYMISITPLSVPDEPHHYAASHILSGYILFEDDPFAVNTRYLDYHAFAGHRNIPQAYLRLINDGIYIFSDEAVYRDFWVKDLYTLEYPLWYIPQAIGLSIARLIGLSFFGAFYFGRFFFY